MQGIIKALTWLPGFLYRNAVLSCKRVAFHRARNERQLEFGFQD